MKSLLNLFTIGGFSCNFLVAGFPLPVPLPDRDGHQGIQDWNHEVETAKQTVANQVAGALEPRGGFGPIRCSSVDGPRTAVLFSPEYDVTFYLALEFRRKHLRTPAVGNDGGTLYHGMMSPVVDGRAVRTLEGSHPGVEGNPD